MSLYQDARPRRFSEVVGQDTVRDILRKQVSRGKTHHAYLFAGPSGTGKTTTARILAQAVNCEHPRKGEPCLKCQGCKGGTSWDVLEHDAASFRGIEEVKSLQGRAYLAPIGKMKVYILDEVQQFTEQAWGALLKLLEEPPSKAMLILCTTDPQKVPSTVRSRCQTMGFQAIPRRLIQDKLAKLAHYSKVEISVSSLKFISGMASGNLRQAEAMLEQVFYLDGGKPSTKQVKQLVQSQML